MNFFFKSYGLSKFWVLPLFFFDSLNILTLYWKDGEYQMKLNLNARLVAMQLPIEIFLLWWFLHIHIKVLVSLLFRWNIIIFLTKFIFRLKIIFDDIINSVKTFTFSPKLKAIILYGNKYTFPIYSNKICILISMFSYNIKKFDYSGILGYHW